MTTAASAYVFETQVLSLHSPAAADSADAADCVWNALGCCQPGHSHTPADFVS